MADPTRLLRGVTDKRVRGLLREAARNGAVLSFTGSGHIKVATRMGATFAAVTPRSPHSYRHLERALRSIGALPRQ